jgi:F0F1-type ATP synthase delta subunit
MRVSDYSKAVLALAHTGMNVDHAFTQLSSMLKTRGHVRLYPRILRDLEVRATKEAVKSTVVVTLARKSDESLLTEELAHALTLLGATSYELRIDESITGGFIAEARERRIDQSHKHRLLTLYRSLIK